MRNILYLIIFALFASPVFAAPSISGVTGSVSDGGTVTISGSNFGSKSTAAPIKFDMFDDGTNNLHLTESGYWSIFSDNSSDKKPKYTNTNNRTGSSLNALVTLATTTNDYFYKGSETFTSYAYINFWLRPSNGNLTGSATAQIKFWRLEHSTTTRPTLANIWQPNASSGWLYYTLTREDATSESAGGTNAGDITNYNLETWNNVELLITMSSGQDAADGVVTVIHDCVQQDQKTGLTMFTGTNRFQGIKLGEFIQDLSIVGEEAEEHYDDVYIDNTFARVAIGNSSVYANCTVREMQPPTAWADGEVTVTFNQGAFSLGEQIYIFVIDSSNVASSGFPITAGEGSLNMTNLCNGTGGTIKFN